MGLLDLFNKKENSYQDITAFNKEVHAHIERLETLSVKLQEQTIAVQALPMKSLPQGLLSFIESLEEHQQKILDTQTAISTFTVMDTGDKDMKQQLGVIERNINTMNSILEMEMKEANTHLKQLHKFCNDFNKPVSNLHTLLEQVANLHEKLEILSLKADKAAATIDEEENSDS